MLRRWRSFLGWGLVVGGVASCDGCSGTSRAVDVGVGDGASACETALRGSSDRIAQLVAEGWTWHHPPDFDPVAIERPATAPPTAPLVVLSADDAVVDGSRFPAPTETLRGDGGAVRHLLRGKLARMGDARGDGAAVVVEVGGEVSWDRVVVVSEMLAGLGVERMALAFDGASAVKEPTVDDDVAAAIPSNPVDAQALLSSEAPGPLEDCAIAIDPKPDLPPPAALTLVAEELPRCGCDVEPAVVERWAWTALGRHQSPAHAIITVTLGGDGEGQAVEQPAATPWSKAHVAVLEAAGDEPLRLAVH